MSEAEQHNKLIMGQFTRMAVPFAEMPAHSDEEAMRVLVDAAAVSKRDRVLDVCCGTGIVACALAPFVEHVTGIDLTPGMIEQAKTLQQRRGLTNLTWQVGDVTTLPFADETFSVVVSRYSFHHLLDPVKVLREMVRVCRRDGRIVVADVFTTTDAQGAAFDRVEKLRDPSHVRALPLDEMKAMFKDAGLAVRHIDFYRLGVELEALLRASCTVPEAANEVRRLLAADIGHNDTGMSPQQIGDAIHFSFPVAVLAGQK